MNNIKNDLNTLNFNRKCRCDFCGCKEICAITTYGTTIYTRLICVECAMSINQNDLAINGKAVFDLNNSKIRFRNFVYDIDNEESEDSEN